MTSEELSKDTFEASFAKAKEQIGRVNIGLFGKTGVGKSSLLNAVFGADISATGVGAPVTRGSKLHLHTDGHLGIIDNEGLEIGSDSKTILKDLKKMVKNLRDAPEADQLHLAWYCVRATDSRFEDVEAEFVRELAALDVPVVLVLTRASHTSTGVVHPEHEALASHIGALGLPIFEGKPLVLSAQGDEGLGFEPFGLLELLDATFRAAPDGVAGAIAAAQILDQSRKESEARKVIAAAAAGAAAIGASPIPFTDAALLVPVQSAMMMRIAALYGLDLGKSTMLALIATQAATQGGRSLVTNLLKFIPGYGTVAGGAISASVASALTAAMGLAWLEVVKRVASGALDPSIMNDAEGLAKIFMDELKNAAKLAK